MAKCYGHCPVCGEHRAPLRRRLAAKLPRFVIRRPRVIQMLFARVNDDELER